MYQTEHLQEKWNIQSTHPDLPEIKDNPTMAGHYNHS